MNIIRKLYDNYANIALTLLLLLVVLLINIVYVDTRPIVYHKTGIKGRVLDIAYGSKPMNTAYLIECTYADGLVRKHVWYIDSMLNDTRGKNVIVKAKDGREGYFIRSYDDLGYVVYYVTYLSSPEYGSRIIYFTVIADEIANFDEIKNDLTPPYKKDK